MKGKPKYRVKHLRKKEVLNLYVWTVPRTAQERQQSKNTLQLAEKIRFEKEPENEDYTQKIFNLPHKGTARKHLLRWVKEAGINKKITWHCARHSFAVNLLNAGADIKTVSSLLGHANIKMTEKYLHVIDSRKQKAINSLGKISFDVGEEEA